MTKKPKPIVMQARIAAGALKVPGRAVLLSALRHWPDGPCDLEVRPFEERRRVRANNFYWKALAIVVAHEREEGVGHGWDKDGWHLKLAERFNAVVLSDVDEVTGEVTERRYGASTAKLSIARFSQYLDDCLDYFADTYGLVIEPTASEDWRDKKRWKAA